MTDTDLNAIALKIARAIEEADGIEVGHQDEEGGRLTLPGINERGKAAILSALTAATPPAPLTEDEVRDLQEELYAAAVSAELWSKYDNLSDDDRKLLTWYAEAHRRARALLTPRASASPAPADPWQPIETRPSIEKLTAVYNAAIAWGKAETPEQERETQEYLASLLVNIRDGLPLPPPPSAPGTEEPTPEHIASEAAKEDGE